MEIRAVGAESVSCSLGKVTFMLRPSQCRDVCHALGQRLLLGWACFCCLGPARSPSVRPTRVVVMRWVSDPGGRTARANTLRF